MNTNLAASCLRPVSIGPFTIRRNRYEAGTSQRRHAHEYAGITLITSGSLEETTGGVTVHARALSLVTKPGDTEHADRFGTAGAQAIQIRFAPHIHDPGALARWHWQHGGPAVRRFLGVLCCLRAGSEHETETAIYDLLAALRSTPVMPGRPPRWLAQACDHIDALLPRAVRVQDIARTAGVHPVYLARQFRRFFGCSVTQHIAARRAQHAAQCMSNPALSLATVAQRAGYADQSHMTRALRAAIGITPRSLQRLLPE